MTQRKPTRKKQRMMSDMLHVGTSGWHYDHWQGPFYPEDLPSDRWLAYYAEHLTTVEVNNSFYQLPEAETLGNWRATTPQGFLFAVKASSSRTRTNLWPIS
jgi:uncharacterized protein YecE (DUF72 family)